MKQFLPITLLLLFASCSSSEKTESSADSLTVENSEPVAASSVNETTPAANTAWNKDSLVNILLRDSIISQGISSISAELTSSSTIQLDRLHEPRKIQGVGLIHEVPSTDNEMMQVEHVMVAFFDVSTEPATLVAYLDYGERVGIVTFGAVELMPGQYAATATYTISGEETQTEDQLTREDRTEVTYFALKETEVLPIFDIVQAKHQVTQGPEGSYFALNEQYAIQPGKLEDGRLCTLEITRSGTQTEQGETEKDLVGEMVRYVFKDDGYREQ